MVTIDNVEEYIDLVSDFCLNVGIRRQMEALKGWSPMNCLLLFSRIQTISRLIFHPVDKFCMLQLGHYVIV